MSKQQNLSTVRTGKWEQPKSNVLTSFKNARRKGPVIYGLTGQIGLPVVSA